MDGKTLRAARLSDGRQVHLLSALDTTTGIVLAQVTVDTKSNEITSFTPLLDAVEKVLGTLTGVLFIADALHTQTGHADEVTARRAHLMVQIKGNQPTLFKQRYVTQPSAGTAPPERPTSLVPSARPTDDRTT
jgi:hypothetical protein